MKPKKLNSNQDSENSRTNEDPDDLNKLVKITILQDKVLKKMIEEIKIQQSTNKTINK